MAKRTKQAVLRDLTRHQVYLEQLKQRGVLDARKAVDELGVAIVSVLQDLRVDTLDELSRRQLNGLLRELREAQTNSALQDLFDEETFTTLAGHEAQWEAAFNNSRANGNPMRAADAAAAYRRALDYPMDDKSGETLKGFFNGVDRATNDRLSGVIRNGWAQGKTVDDMVREVRGTRAGKFKDGVLQRTKQDAETYVRTAIQHVSQQARMATWEENNDIVEKYSILATLDLRTSDICRFQDGKVYELNKGPTPPLHPRCRSTTIAELPDEFAFLNEGATRSSANGYVDAETDYYEWLKTQPRADVEQVLGKTRAKLFLDGNISPDDYAKYGIDSKTFQPLTLQQMMDKDAAPFKAAGVDTWPGKPKVVEVPPAPTPKTLVESYKPGFSADSEERFQLNTRFIESGNIEGSKRSAEIMAAISDDFGDLKLLRDTNGKIAGALSYTDLGDGDWEISHLGSVQKGGGSELVKEALRDMLEADKGLERLQFASLPGAHSFYTKLGFTLGDGEELDDAAQIIFDTPRSKLLSILKRLDQ